jgi:hypothetical protein
MYSWIPTFSEMMPLRGISYNLEEVQNEFPEIRFGVLRV